MAKFQSPLLGYNNNVRHRGRIFHIQTEDSGVNHPHIITHLFMDGGRILKSVKKSYAEHVGSDGLSETVRVLMKEQHKAMFIALRDGQFDELVEGGTGSTAKKPSGKVVAPPTPSQQTAVESAKKNATAAKAAIEATFASAEAKAAAEAKATAEAEAADAKATDAAKAADAAAKPDTKPDTKPEAKPAAARTAAADAPVTPRKHPPPKIDLSKIERPKADSKIDAAAVEAAAAKAAAATAKVLADEEPAFLTELAKSPEVVAAMIAITEATGGGSGATSLIPATHPDPPRPSSLSSDEMPPNTLADEEIDLDNLPLPSDSDEVMVVDIDDPPPPPPPPSVRIPSPQSTTDPSAVLERAATVAAMPASGGPKQPAVVAVEQLPPSTIDENPNTMRDPERQERQERQERRRQSAEELTLDFDALERDFHSDQVSAHFQTTDLPPPPKNLFAAKERVGVGTGTYSAVVDDEPPPSRPQPNTARSGQSPTTAATTTTATTNSSATPAKPSQKPGSEGRYAPARPAAIFGASSSSSSSTNAKPPPVQAPAANASLFNDDLVSDKSLDEVILSYLAEDLDPPRRK